MRLLQTIDTHTGGMPTRTVVGGLPRIPGSTMAQKLSYARAHLDGLRRLLVDEPRGSAVMSGALLTEPTRADCQLGVLFIEVGGFLPMCGHDTIGLCTALVESGRIPATGCQTRLALDTPAGPIEATVHMQGGRVQAVSFENTPAFVYKAGVAVAVEGWGTVVADIAYGGCFNAIVEVGQLGLRLEAGDAPLLVSAGTAIRRAVNRQIAVRHPLSPAIEGVSHVQFVDSAGTARPGLSAVVIPQGPLDRSPCGTGTSARMALLHSRGQLEVGQDYHGHSLWGSTFVGRLLGEGQVAGLPSVRPRITGSAYITAFRTLVLDQRDPFPQGFPALR